MLTKLQKEIVKSIQKVTSVNIQVDERLSRRKYIHIYCANSDIIKIERFGLEYSKFTVVPNGHKQFALIH